MDIFALLTAVTLGFFGSAHCVGMCGGIAGALGFAVRDASPTRRLIIICAYNVGRIASYLAIAALTFWLIQGGLGAAGQALPNMPGLSYMRILAGLLMIAMGLYLAQWWMGLSYLERIGRLLWRYIQPLGQGLFPIQSPTKALLLGLVWGWLPCGLVYSALVFAAVQPTLPAVLSTMLAFAIGTLPAMVAAGLAAERIKQYLQHRRVRMVLALLIIGFGIWTCAAAVYHGLLHHQHTGNNAHHENMQMDGVMPAPEDAHHMMDHQQH